MAKDSSHEPLYPPERAFVVQFRRDESDEKAPLRGRIEHIPSGKSVRFEGLEQLLEFVQQSLEATGQLREEASRGVTPESPSSTKDSEEES